MPDKIRQLRTKPIKVYFTDTAKWDVEGYQVSDLIIDRILSSLETDPVSDKDRVRGTVFYRTFENWDVMFQVTSAPEELMIDVCGVRPKQEESTAKKVKKALDVIGQARGVTGI